MRTVVMTLASMSLLAGLAASASAGSKIQLSMVPTGESSTVVAGPKFKGKFSISGGQKGTKLKVKGLMAGGGDYTGDCTLLIYGRVHVDLVVGETEFGPAGLATSVAAAVPIEAGKGGFKDTEPLDTSLFDLEKTVGFRGCDLFCGILTDECQVKLILPAEEQAADATGDDEGVAVTLDVDGTLLKVNMLTEGMGHDCADGLERVATCGFDTTK